MFRPGDVLMGCVATGLAFVTIVFSGGAGATLLAEADAESLLRHGVELRRAGDDEGALREFQKAYAVDHSPRAAAQVGLAEQALGLWADAEGHVSEALRAGASHPWVQKNQAALTQALFTIKKHVARIELSGPPAGALVTISGRRAGTTPFKDALRVNEGPLTIKIEAEGRRTVRRDLTMTGGQFLRLSIELDPAPEPTASAASKVPAAGAGPESLRRPPRLAVAPDTSARSSATDVDLPGSASRASDEPDATRSGSHTWLWMTLGALAAAGAATVVLLAMRGTTYPTADGQIGAGR
jgi:hypothetical protein